MKRQEIEIKLREFLINNPKLELIDYDMIDEVHKVDDTIFVFRNMARKRIELHTVEWAPVEGYTSFQLDFPFVSNKILRDVREGSKKNSNILQDIEDEWAVEEREEIANNKRKRTARKAMAREMLYRNI